MTAARRRRRARSWRWSRWPPSPTATRCTERRGVGIARTTPRPSPGPSATISSRSSSAAQRSSSWPSAASSSALRPLLWAGFGVTAYGVAYVVVHDLLVHQRLGRLPLADSRYIRWVAAAHAHHHRYGAEPFGFLLPVGKRPASGDRHRRAARSADQPSRRQPHLAGGRDAGPRGEHVVAGAPRCGRGSRRTGRGRRRCNAPTGRGAAAMPASASTVELAGALDLEAHQLHATRA